MSTRLSKSMESRLLFYDLKTYHKLGETGMIPRNTELIHGVILRKMTISPIHSKIVTKLGYILNKILPEGFIVRQEKPISIQNSEPEPDISVVRGTYDDFGEEHPETAEHVIEVANSSLEEDMDKAEIYASARIPFYWIVDLKGKKLHVFQNPENGKYNIHSIFEPSFPVKIPHSDKEISLNELL